jgi:hypothetical protein
MHDAANESGGVGMVLFLDIVGFSDPDAPAFNPSCCK